MKLSLHMSVMRHSIELRTGARQCVPKIILVLSLLYTNQLFTKTGPQSFAKSQTTNTSIMTAANVTQEVTRDLECADIGLLVKAMPGNGLVDNKHLFFIL